MPFPLSFLLSMVRVLAEWNKNAGALISKKSHEIWMKWNPKINPHILCCSTYLLVLGMELILSKLMV